MKNVVRGGMLALSLMACSSVVAREPQLDARDAKLGVRALDRTLVAGTLIEVTVEDARARRRNPRGDTLTATVSADVKNGHRWVVIPAGSPVGFRIARGGPARYVSQADAQITLEMLSLTVRDRLYPLRAAVALTSLAVYQPSGEAVVVAPGTRILFVLSEGFTATGPRPSSR